MPIRDDYARAPDLLRGYVASAVGYQSHGVPQEIHRGLPSPYLTFIFSLGEPVVTGTTIERARGPGADRTQIVLGGLHHRPAFVRPDPQQCGLQLAVHPLAARALLGAPARDLLPVTDGVDVLGPVAENLRQRLAELAGWPERFVLLRDYLRARLAHAPRAGVRDDLAEAWRWLAWHRGTGSIEGLARHVALSPRQLTTLFAREVGASPKQVSRLMRFEHAKQRVARSIAADRPPALSRIAADCGYFDLAHLDRDFAQYAGISPTGWIAEERLNIQAGGHLNGEDWGHDHPDPADP